MNEENKTPRKLDDSRKVTGSSNAVSPSGWKKLLSKRWVFPAAYMAAAAIIVTILWLNSGTGQKDQADVPVSGIANEEGVVAPGGSPAVEAAATNGETLQWPVAKIEEMTTMIPFYEASASVEEREAATVEFNNTFTPHMATDLARKDAMTFDVLAAMSGKVTVASQTPMNGYEVQIEHPNGLVTVYQSLTNLKVQLGDEIEQGEVIAAAGNSNAETQEGVHVHFEVRKNGQSINPTSLIKAAE